jgi:hypothetical protein
VSNGRCLDVLQGSGLLAANNQPEGKRLPAQIWADLFSPNFRSEMIDLDILALNENIQDSIFTYKVGELPAQVTSLFENIVSSGTLSLLAADDIQRFNQFFRVCLESLQNRDYLHLADVLQYEIIPMLIQ